MEMHQIRYFLAVYGTVNFTRAAVLEAAQAAGTAVAAVRARRRQRRAP